MTSPLGPRIGDAEVKFEIGIYRVKKICILTRLTSASLLFADEHVGGQGIVDGDCPSQRLTLGCQHGSRLVGVQDDRWSRVLHACKWQVGVRLRSSFELEMMDGVDVEHLTLAQMRPNPLLRTL
jgi:hypothetical protein